MTRPEFTRSAVLRGGSMVAAGSISSSALAAVFTTILAVELGDEGFGTFSFVIATAGLLSAVARFGLGPIVVRDVAKSGTDDAPGGTRTSILDAIVLTGVFSTLLALLTISPLGISTFHTLGNLDATMVGALALLFTAQALYATNVESLRALHRLGSAAFLGLPTQRLIGLALVVWAVYVTAEVLDVTLALWFTATAAMTAVAVSGFMLWVRSRRMPGNRPTPSGAAKMAKAGAPILLTDVLGVTSNRMPVWVLAALGALDETGTFALALAFVALIRLAHKTMVGTLAPFVATSYYAGERDDLQARIRVAAAATSLLALAAGIVLIVVGLTAVPRLFGSDFENVVPVASILLLGTLAVSLGGPCGILLNLTGNERWMTRATTISVVLAAVAIIPAADLSGAIGAAVVMAATAVVRVGLQVRYASRRTGILTVANFPALVRALRRSRTWRMLGRRRNGPQRRPW